MLSHFFTNHYLIALGYEKESLYVTWEKLVKKFDLTKFYQFLNEFIQKFQKKKQAEERNMDTEKVLLSLCSVFAGRIIHLSKFDCSVLEGVLRVNHQEVTRC